MNKIEQKNRVITQSMGKSIGRWVENEAHLQKADKLP
jgi:hypothetical protein